MIIGALQSEGPLVWLKGDLEQIEMLILAIVTKIPS